MGQVRRDRARAQNDAFVAGVGKGWTLRRAATEAGLTTEGFRYRMARDPGLAAQWATARAAGLALAEATAKERRLAVGAARPVTPIEPDVLAARAAAPEASAGEVTAALFDNALRVLGAAPGEPALKMSAAEMIALVKLNHAMREERAAADAAADAGEPRIDEVAAEIVERVTALKRARGDRA